MEILRNLITHLKNKTNSSKIDDELVSNNEVFASQIGNDQITLHNRLFYLDEVDSLGLKLNPMFEPEETRLCSALIDDGDICLDIGANIGYYTSLFSNIVGKSGQVIAVEPDPENYKILTLNCASYQNESYSIDLHQVALSNESGSALLFKSKDNHGMHRLYSSVCCSNDSSEVSVVKGDSLFTGSVDFIKIDIEGYELPALKGLSEIIKVSENIKIINEFSPLSIGEAGFLSKNLIELMLGYGLVPLENIEGNWFPAKSEALLDAAEIADQVDIPTLTKNMTNQSNQEIAEAAAKALIDVGYPRPLIENLVWLRPCHLNNALQKLSHK